MDFTLTVFQQVRSDSCRHPSGTFSIAEIPSQGIGENIGTGVRYALYSSMFAPILCEGEIHSVRAGYYKFLY